MLEPERERQLTREVETPLPSTHPRMRPGGVRNNLNIIPRETYIRLGVLTRPPKLSRSPRHLDQVWCKCNWTAANVVPWPLPDGLDFMSYHTLRILHDSQQALPIPPHAKFRPSGAGRYAVGAN